MDFAKFGAIEAKPLSRIKKISGANLARNWVMIPHVTNNDEADITELEAFRVSTNKENEKSGVKVTMLAFVIKAVVAALKKFPEFNASLDGDTLVYKQYFHIGFAADTPNGLVVPVLRDADKKGILQISAEMGELAKKARDGKLGAADMQGGALRHRARRSRRLLLAQQFLELRLSRGKVGVRLEVCRPCRWLWLGGPPSLRVPCSSS